MFGDASLRAGDAVPRLSLRDRILALRDGLLASERFRGLVVAFPLTRFVARRRARALFDLVAGFVYSQTLQACVSLDLFEKLEAGPRPVEDLATICNLSEDSMLRLLKAAASLDLLQERSGGRYGLGPLGSSLRGSPGIAAMVRHHALLYADLADPVALLRRGPAATRLGGYWTYAQSAAAGAASPGAADDYCALMSASQRMVRDEIFATRPFDNCTRLLDVGGGDGTFARAAAMQYPQLSIAIADLPPVAAIARERLRASDLEDRVEVFDCDFKFDVLPQGADAISLVRILHDHDDEVAQALLKSIWRALPPGGRIVIGEPMAQAQGAEPVGDAYFGFYLLAMGSGRARSPVEIAGMLERAGFVAVRRLRPRMPLVASVVIASKPTDKIN